MKEAMRERDWKRERESESTVAIKIVFVTATINLYKNWPSRIVPRANLLKQILPAFVFWHTLYKFIVLGSLDQYPFRFWAWAPIPCPYIYNILSSTKKK